MGKIENCKRLLKEVGGTRGLYINANHIEDRSEHAIGSAWTVLTRESRLFAGAEMLLRDALTAELSADRQSSGGLKIVLRPMITIRRRMPGVATATLPKFKRIEGGFNIRRKLHFVCG
jgi:hypothetical protein